jgi:hypothetical protein
MCWEGTLLFHVRQGVKLGSWLGKVQHVGCLPELQVRRLCVFSNKLLMCHVGE